MLVSKINHKACSSWPYQKKEFEFLTPHDAKSSYLMIKLDLPQEAPIHTHLVHINKPFDFMQPARKIEEKIDQRLQNQPLWGGNLL